MFLVLLPIIGALRMHDKLSTLVAVARATLSKSGNIQSYKNLDNLVSWTFEGVPEEFTFLTRCYVGPCQIWQEFNDACCAYGKVVAAAGTLRGKEGRRKLKDAHVSMITAISDSFLKLSPWFEKISSRAVTAENEVNWLMTSVEYLRKHSEFQAFIFNHPPEPATAKSLSSALAAKMMNLLKAQAEATRECEKLLSRAAMHWLSSRRNEKLSLTLIKAYHRIDIKVLELLVFLRRQNSETDSCMVILFCILKSLDVSVKTATSRMSGELQNLWKDRFESMEAVVEKWRMNFRSNRGRWDLLVKLQLKSIWKFLNFKSSLPS